MSITTKDGASLDCVQRGRGEPVVLVHGSASDRRTWDGQLEPLSRRYHVTAYSRRYHWPNDPIPEGAEYSMARHVEDLDGALDALGEGPAHLVGHSYGAFVILRLAIDAPGRVRSLVLVEPPVLPLFTSEPPRVSEMLRLLFTRPRAALAIAGFGARGIAPASRAFAHGDLDRGLEIFGRAVLGKEAFERLSPARLRQARANTFAAEFRGAVFSALRAPEVSSVRAPTLLVVGRRSPRVFHHFAQRLRELMPHAQWADVPDASHMVHEDNPDDFGVALAAFLRQHEAHPDRTAPGGRGGAAEP